jgi:hypothetical protein
VHTTVLALKEFLAVSTRQKIAVVSTPTNRLANDAVSIWVWRIDEESLVHGLPSSALQAPPVPPLTLSCMVYAPDIETLDLVRTTLSQNPMVGPAGQRVMVSLDRLDAVLLVNLFIAVKMLPRPCLNYILRAQAG